MFEINVGKGQNRHRTPTYRDMIYHSKSRVVLCRIWLFPAMISKMGWVWTTLKQSFTRLHFISSVQLICIHQLRFLESHPLLASLNSRFSIAILFHVIECKVNCRCRIERSLNWLKGSSDNFSLRRPKPFYFWNQSRKQADPTYNDSMIYVYRGWHIRVSLWVSG